MTSFQVRTRAHVLNLYHSMRRQQRWTWARIASQDIPDIEIVETSLQSERITEEKNSKTSEAKVLSPNFPAASSPARPTTKAATLAASNGVLPLARCAPATPARRSPYPPFVR